MEQTRQKRRASMADVARMAGVSSQTVSRYFTGAGYVRQETRERIAIAIDELGYRPNQAARNLRSRRSNSIGVLLVGALNYGAVGVISGLSEAARAAGMMLPIAHIDLDYEGRGWQSEAQRAIEHFLSAQVDGIIASTVVPGIEDFLSSEASVSPMLAISELTRRDHASISMHSYSAGRLATRHLVQHGHRRIVHLAGPLTRNEAVERERGYRDAMDEAGLEPLVVHGALDWDAGAGRAAAAQIDPTSFTGVVAANDEIALGCMSHFARQGLFAPSDYSIVGVDDMPEAEHFWPPLTTVRLDFTRLGREAFELMRRMIETGERGTHIDLDPELVIRESTAPPQEKAAA
jgi:DNA-binding LacI/PurR family transcriptional regulator